MKNVATASTNAWRKRTFSATAAQRWTRPAAAATASRVITPAAAPLPPSQTRYADAVSAAMRPAQPPSNSPMIATGTTRASTKTPSTVWMREIMRMTASPPQPRPITTIQSGHRRGSSGANQP